MTNRKTTKRALLTSVTALALCVVMLVGTTFAWFTDTATTNVNKIQAGNLDVGLQMLVTAENGKSVWQDAENRTLEWVKSKDAPTNEAILWEPGCTYSLPQLRVVNYGNLALKYEIKITGTQGDAKLLEALEFSVDGTLFNSADGTYTGTLAAGSKEVPTASEGLTITGHMKEEANNDYQNLSLDGIAITVYATQATAEFDSFGNQYDAGAFDALKALYPVSKSAAVTKDATGAKQDVTINDADAGSTAPKTFEVTVPAAAMDENTDNISVTISKAASADTAKFTVSDGNKLEQFDVTVTGIKDGNTENIEVKLFIGKGYTFTDNRVTVYHKDSTTENTITGTYDSTTGFVSFKTKSFSPFAVEVPEMAAAIGTGHDVTYYSTLTDAVAAAKDGETITLVKDSVGKGLWLAAADKKTITIDFNGHTYAVSELVGSSGSENQAAHFEKGNAVTLKNGTLKVADSAASGAKILVQNYCNLTASNMTFDGTNLMLMSQQPVTLSNNDGAEKFSNCTVIAAKRETAIAVDAAVWGSYAGADVTLNNCTVYGALDVGKYEYDSNKKVYVKTEDLFLKNDGTPCITVIDGSYTDLKSAVLAATTGSTITLLDNVVIDNTIVVKGKTVTVDLNGKTVSNASDIWNEKTGNWSLFSVRGENGNLTITGNGALAAKKDDCYAVDVQDGAALTIENGTFVGNIHAVYVLKGTANINGGTYSVQQKYNQVGKEDEFVLNCYDANRKAGTAKIIVTGGTFANFNPADCQAEGANTNFLADGYKTTSEIKGDVTWWTVIK